MPPARAPKGGARKKPANDASPSQESPPPEVDDDEEEEEPAKKIPEELVARVMHEFFKREDTRVSRAASKALGRYFEIFVQEAVARTKQERGGRFLEVGCSPSPAPFHHHLFPSPLSPLSFAFQKGQGRRDGETGSGY
ncbi:hypothetical protein IMZ48_24155 [Candidatus Bathyarchaeota archaeon]|nr:hypothetical protein [Candidatus Bathyarchaeota archaeon]